MTSRRNPGIMLHLTCVLRLKVIIVGQKGGCTAESPQPPWQAQIRHLDSRRLVPSRQRDSVSVELRKVWGVWSVSQRRGKRSRDRLSS